MMCPLTRTTPLTTELDHRRESLSSADSDSTTFRSCGIDSVMRHFDNGIESVAHSSRNLAQNSESIVASKHMPRAALYATSSNSKCNDVTFVVYEGIQP